jgi:hypothetical protein
VSSPPSLPDYGARYHWTSNAKEATVVDLSGLPLDEYHRAGHQITNGNPGVYKELYSRADDVTLANPFGPPVRGWSEVSVKLDSAADNYRDGRSWDSKTSRRS